MNLKQQANPATDKTKRSFFPQEQLLEEKLRNGKHYVWTQEKDEVVRKGFKEGLSYNKIAKRLNDAFPDGRRATGRIVNTRTKQVCGDLETPRVCTRHYEWTDAKIELLEILVAKKLDCDQIAKELNKEFPSDVKANRTIVGNRLNKDVFKRNPGLRWNRYNVSSREWTPDELDFLEALSDEKLGYGKMIKRLEERYSHKFHTADVQEGLVLMAERRLKRAARHE